MSIVSLIADSSASQTSTRPVHSLLQRDLHSFPCLHRAPAPTRLSSEHDPAVHHIQTPAQTLASVSLAQRWVALLAAVLLSSMRLWTTDSLPWAGQFIPLVVRPCSCSVLTTLHIGALEEEFRCNFLNLLLDAFGGLAGNHCCLESKTIRGGASPESVIIAPRGVVGREPRMDRVCR